MNHTTPSIRIGTRGSELALVQAEMTEAALARNFPELKRERIVITTTGDRRTDVSLAQVAKAEGTFDKGVFIKELEQALSDGSIDIAVHSLKDMPTVLEPQFALAAVLKRAPVRDVLVSRTPGGIEALPEGARIGTSSVRRAQEITFFRPDVQPSDLRGNVPTRLRKLADGGNYDAILLAEAGLIRLGFIAPEHPPGDETVNGIDGIFATRLAEEWFLPAAGQGAVALEIRAGDTRAAQIAAILNDPPTWLRITAEREFLRLLDGGCHTPVGVFSSLDAATGVLEMRARVFPETGGTPRTATASGTEPIATAHALFHSLA